MAKAKQWYSQNLLNTEQFKCISHEYPIQSPKSNVFIKTGAFVFTLIIIAASVGLYSLFYFTTQIKSMDTSLYGIFTGAIFGSICAFFLERFIQNKKIHNGVDDALLYSALAFIYITIYASFSNLYDTSIQSLLISIFYLPFLIVAALRYLDRLVTLLASVCSCFIYFQLLLKLGSIAKWITPFAFMAYAAGLYIFANKQLSKPKAIYNEPNIMVIKVFALLLFYLSGNYFIIRESSVKFFQLVLKEGDDIPLAFFFYLFTALMPLTYLFYGLKTKDKSMLLASLGLIAVSALTFKYYFSLGHPEVMLSLVGVMMIAIAYSCINYLKTDKHGITFKEGLDEDSFFKSNAEALIIAQNLHGRTNNSENKVEMGGGEFGGAGSGEQF